MKRFTNREYEAVKWLAREIISGFAEIEQYLILWRYCSRAGSEEILSALDISPWQAKRRFREVQTKLKKAIQARLTANMTTTQRKYYLLWLEGWTQADIARRYWVSRQNVSNSLKNAKKIWQSS